MTSCHFARNNFPTDKFKREKYKFPLFSSPVTFIRRDSWGQARKRGGEEGYSVGNTMQSRMVVERWRGKGSRSHEIPRVSLERTREIFSSSPPFFRARERSPSSFSLSGGWSLDFGRILLKISIFLRKQKIVFFSYAKMDRQKGTRKVFILRRMKGFSSSSNNLLLLPIYP